MAVNSNVGFKLGTQAAVDNLITSKASVTIGSFYLTSDTHRLYIGEADGLHPVNEGVITVQKISDLPSVNTSNSAAYAGRFYYIKEENILCVYNGSAWAQINSDTYVKENKFVAVKLEGQDIVRIDNDIYNYTAGNMTSTTRGQFMIEGKNGIKATVETVTDNGNTIHKIVLTGDKYTLETEQSGDNAKVKLLSENTDNDTAVEFVPGLYEGAGGADASTNVSIKVDAATKKISFAVKDTVNKTMKGEAISEGFKVSLTDSFNKTLEALLDPQITYGVDSKETVKFLNGTATLDIYSKREIQETLRALNAMTYRGTIGNNGSAASHIQTSGTSPNYTYKVMNNSTEVKVSIGDVFMVSGSDKVSLNGGSTYLSTSTLLIVKGGAEGADGYVTNPVFDLVESTVDFDTTYYFESVGASDVTNGGGINLKSSTNSTDGKFIVVGGAPTGGAKIDITRESSKLASGKGYQEKLTVKHGEVTRTDTTGAQVDMTPQTGNFEQQVTIPVITKVTTDKTGHITGIETKNHVIKDTNAKMSKVEYDTSVYEKSDGTNVGVVKMTATIKSALQADSSQNGSMTLNSQSLKISNQDGNGVTNGGSAVAGLQIEMVWGEF